MTTTTKNELREMLRAEGLISLADAARECGVSVNAALRWVVHGRGGVRLEACRVRGQWHTSRQAVQRFRGAGG